MSYKGYQFYDDDQNFQKYLERRNWAENANDTIEKPIFLELLSDVKGHSILDLGCGTAAFGLDLLDLGAYSYTGVEGSANMVEESKKIMNRTNGKVVHTSMEDWNSPEASYQLIISRLAIHYLPEIDEVFSKVHRSLAHGGSFIFSVEHPVMTSSFGIARPEGMKQDWVVDNYFHSGIREQEWLGGKAIKYHRTIEDYFHALRKAGFAIESLRESKPRAEQFHNAETYERRMRIPLFLFFKGTKPVSTNKRL
ncbi:class I SAM-dependent DNA methyltransferase [Cohnella faecalis]|uniref:Class I SAM-dependent methyltransferase n=1 Tax=Cohnella faecalis TaxID=2315694 RepID=A0A398CR25_9BACL|nr:class I SAM-dependent methyltransferase [Cohnella faecalis]RIE03719.1 class I SAM-dependent methyltransferase [Cohnella faecalis]